MTKNPIINSLLATGYISLIALVMDTVSKQLPKGPQNFLAPTAFVSMFTLSTAVMGLIFGYQPFKLYFDSKKKEAINLLFKTVLAFAITTLILLSLIFFGVIGIK